MTASPQLSKPEKKQNGDKKSPAKDKGAERAPSRASKGSGDAGGVDHEPRAQDFFSWFRVFRMADMMLRQGC